MITVAIQLLGIVKLFLGKFRAVASTRTDEHRRFIGQVVSTPFRSSTLADLRLLRFSQAIGLTSDHQFNR